MPTIYYLGPEGTFTHAATLQWVEDQEQSPSHPSSSPGIPNPSDLVPLETNQAVVAAVETEPNSFGVIPIENTIEGVVVPSLDALLAARDVVAIAEVVLPISFDAFTRPHDDSPPTEVTAHPHALAQCTRFIAEHGLKPVPASSNAAACRDLQPGQVALGPAACGALYGLTRMAEAVADYHGARTRFLVLAPRSAAADLLPDGPGLRTMAAITPTATGPGVLARIANAFGGLGVNMSSLVTRPIKARVGQYVFVVTYDAAPWDPAARAVLEYLISAGDAVKTLAVYRADPLTESVDSVLPSTVPIGSVHRGDDPETLKRGLLW